MCHTRRRHTDAFPVLGVSQTKVSCSEKTKAAAVLATGNNQSKRTHCFRKGHGRNPRRKAGGVDLGSEGPILGERRCCSTNRGAEAIVWESRLARLSRVDGALMRDGNEGKERNCARAVCSS